MKITSDDFGRKFYDTCGNKYSIFRVIGSVVELFKDDNVSIHRLVGKEFLYKSGGDYISIGLYFDRWEDDDTTNKTRHKDLRDEFAMVALGGLLNTDYGKTPQNYTNAITKRAYDFADAMMKARDAK